MSKFYPKIIVTLFSMLFSLALFAQVSVTATAGTTGPTTYTTLKLAFDAINAGTHNGVVTVSITANTTETAAATLNRSGSGAASYTSVLVKPASGVTATISGSVSNSALVRILGSNVTIDGSNTNGGITRDLSITNTSATAPQVVLVGSSGATAVTNVTVKNIIATNGTNGSSAIVIADAAGTGGTFSNIRISNNKVQKAYVGIYALATVAAGNGSIVIDSNELNSTAANAVRLAGIYVQGSDGATVRHNTVANFSVEAESDRGIWFATGTTNSSIYTNTVSTLAVSGVTAVSPVGILVSSGVAAANINVYDNTITGLTGTGTSTPAGFSISGATGGVNFYKNKIRNVKNTHVDGYGAAGILLGSTSSTANILVHNNFVSDVAAVGYDDGTASDNGNGIVVNAGGGYGIYFNTVSMNTNQTVAGRPAAFLVTAGVSAAGAVNVRNNIFSNTQTQTGERYAIYSAAPSTVFAAIDNNVYWTTGPNLGYIGSNRADLAAIQAGFGANLNSVAVQPVFVSATDLHLVPASNGGIDSRGVSISGITTDIDNETRSVTPDPGADEMPASGDALAPGISYTQLGFTCSGADRTLTATIADATGVATGANAPRIYYKKSTGSTWYSRAGTLTSGDAISGVWSFTIVNSDMGGVVSGDIVQYYIIAQDVMATPNVGSSPAGATASNVNTVTSPPGSPNTYFFGANLSGTFTVGASGTYTSLPAAINAWNQGCLTGPVVFQLIDATYTLTSDLTINSPFASATNTLLIKPAAGVIPAITGAIGGAMVKIQSPYVTIDGSNNGTTSRDLSITNTGTSSPSVIHIGSSGTTHLTNVTVKNTNITNGANTSTAIVISDMASGTAGYFKDITIQNNSIKKSYIGIYAIAAVAAANGANLNISNNTMNTSGADAIRLMGVYVQGVDGATVSGNTIGNFESLSVETDRGIWLATGTTNTTVSNNTISGLSYTGAATGVAAPIGITVSTNVAASNVNVTGNTISGLTSAGQGTTSGINITAAIATGGVTIQKNKISNIKNTNTGGYGANGIQLSSTATGANINVMNNFISDVAGYGWTSAGVGDNGYGIIITSGSGYNVDFNTVLMNTNQTLVGGKPAAINITSGVTAVGAINLRNNLFINTQTVGTDRYAIYSGAANTVFGTINHNDYYSTGPNLGYIGSNRADLAAIQAGFGGNTNSVSALPVFVSATDLHLATAGNAAVEDKGTPVAGITVDIDDNTRSSTPDLGADEILTCLLPGTPGTITGPGSVCTGTGPHTYSITAVTDATSYVWTVPTGWVITSGQGTTSINVTPGTAGQNGNITVAAVNACGTTPASSLAVTSNGTPAVPGTITGSTGQCTGATGQTYSIAAVPTATTYTWTVPTGWSITGGQGTTSVTVTAGTTGQNGNITVTAGNSCGTSAAASLAVSVVSSATINTQPTAQSACTGQSATFTVSAVGSNLTYQWRKGGVNISGATGASYTINSVSASDAANYDVVINSSCGSAVTSNSVALTVTPSAAITAHPQSQSVCTGANVTFTVTATGTGLTYQWRKNGSNITGATTSTLTLTGVTAADAADYSVVVGSTCGPVTSNNATLTVGGGSVWTGTGNTDWNNAANWCNGVPTASTDVTIPSGTANAPTINATANVRNLTIASGATVTVTASGRLNIHGNFVNNGTLSAASGTVAFQGTAAQTSSGFTAANVIVNGSGVTLTGNLTVGTALTLTAGNITTGNNIITLNGSTTGSASSHIVTNGTGAVIVNNVTSATTVPVGPDATSYNPVIISNGQGRNFTVKVATGITPAIQNNAIGINRTWAVVPNTVPPNAVTLTFQYADSEGNASAVGGNAMDVGVHNGTNWYKMTNPGGVTPTGTAASRQVTVQTFQFGPMAIANVGGISTLTTLPSIDQDVTSAVLMPNVFESNTMLRLITKRSMKVNWTITDARGRVVMAFSGQAFAGQNDIMLKLGHLAGGVYFLHGETNKGSTGVLRFVRL